jgi:hypothetical protein
MEGFDLVSSDRALNFHVNIFNFYGCFLTDIPSM